MVYKVLDVTQPSEVLSLSLLCREMLSCTAHIVRAQIWRNMRRIRSQVSELSCFRLAHEYLGLQEKGVQLSLAL